MIVFPFQPRTSHLLRLAFRPIIQLKKTCHIALFFKAVVYLISLFCTPCQNRKCMFWVILFYLSPSLFKNGKRQALGKVAKLPYHLKNFALFAVVTLWDLLNDLIIVVKRLSLLQIGFVAPLSTYQSWSLNSVENTLITL